MRDRLVCWAVVFCTVIVAGRGRLSAITLDELRQTAAESRMSVTTAHVVYVEQWTDNEPAAGEAGTIEYKVNESRRDTVIEVDVLLDSRARRAKSVLTDLRDVNALLAEYELPDEDVVRHNVSRTETHLYKDDYAMIFDARIPLLHLWKPGGEPEYVFRFARLGVISNDLLVDEKSPRLSEVMSDGKSMLQIKASSQVPAGTVDWVVECDPALGYRFRTVRSSRNGQVISEVIADDYRDVNGIPCPFAYIERRLYDDGSFRTERQYAIQEAQFGVPLTKDDFKVYVPSGTEFTDAAVSGICSRIGLARPFGIDDALKIGRAMERDR